MIVLPIMAIAVITTYIIWYHRTQFRRKLHWIHTTATDGILTRADLPWIWKLLEMPGLAARAEAEG